MITTNPTLPAVQRAIARRMFCTLGTASARHRPHAASVIYAEVEGALWLSTMRSSRKARNIAANHHVSISIPVRRLPVGPPSSIQFASTAELRELDDPEALDLAAAGRLKAITGHGELQLDGGCLVRVAPPDTYHTYGLGLPLHRLIRDPLNAAGRVDRTGAQHRPPVTR
jgi:hypothetical protein